MRCVCISCVCICSSCVCEVLSINLFPLQLGIDLVGSANKYIRNNSQFLILSFLILSQLHDTSQLSNHNFR